MYQISNEKLGKFISELRKENNFTQKDLAEKLFVSDKTVSKWERGASIPNVALLIPVSEVLGVTVTELLKGERNAGGQCEEDLFCEPVHEQMKRDKKKWKLAYVICSFIAAAEIVLFAISGISFRETGDSFAIMAVMMFFAAWLCFWAKDTLPGYYDKNKIHYVSQGIFKIHMVGLAFNNGNWSYVLNVFKIFSLGIAVLYPAFCYFCFKIEGANLWNEWKSYAIVFVLLAMLITTYIVGKKYE